MTISLIAAAFIVMILCVFFEKKQQNKKVRNTFEKWRWWVQIVDADYKPWLSGKVVRKTDSYQFAIVGCLERDHLDSELLNNLESKLGTLGSFIPCQCIIIDASELVIGGVTDNKKITALYESIPPQQSHCVKLVIQDSSIIIPESNEDLHMFKKLWENTEMQDIEISDNESELEVYSV
ncbi:hypothetical protein [Vibrio cionasavignyae]|uniref:hypothetical protein n=1 Tax=Vibrio cionasavignyae TaxID=2910252 RepID=UPI003D0E319A